MGRFGARNNLWLLGASAVLIGLAVGCALALLKRWPLRGAATVLPAPQRLSVPTAVAELPPGGAAGEPIEFSDVTPQSGVTFRHTHGGSGQLFIMETMSAGLALVDYDGDGLIDIYFPNGAPLRGSPPETSAHHALYRNLGAWRFEDVSERSGVACRAFGLGVTAGDYDNDGHADLYLSNFGPNVLYHNRGDGTFADVSSRAGVQRGTRVGAGVAMLDADCDGLLDLFVANYVRFAYETHKPRVIGGVPFYPGPLDHSPETNQLFLNRGDGTFVDASTQSGIARPSGTGMGVSCGDYDDDGDTDIYVANDEMANFLFANDGRGRFSEVAIPSGVAYDIAGIPQASMGVDFGDFDNDGLLDLYVTAYRNESATLYRNLGGGFFHDVTSLARAGEGTPSQVTWGCALVDLDNDGDRDLFIACGHTDQTIGQREPKASYLARSIVLRNLLAETGKARFVNVSDACGAGLQALRCARGAAFDDLDNDGDIDVVILNSRDRASLLRNMLIERGCRNHWLQIRLRGVKTNRDGIGARVRVRAGDLTLVDEVHSGRGYQSHWGSRLHFGLGPHQRVDRIEIRWIGGGVDVLEDVRADQLLVIAEGTR